MRGSSRNIVVPASVQGIPSVHWRFLEKDHVKGCDGIPKRCVQFNKQRAAALLITDHFFFPRGALDFAAMSSVSHTLCNLRDVQLIISLKHPALPGLSQSVKGTTSGENSGVFSFHGSLLLIAHIGFTYDF